MAADAAGKSTDDPWACPRCGCRGPHRVESTYDTQEGRARRRICRQCGKGLIKTVEIPKQDGFKIVKLPDDERAVA